MTRFKVIDAEFWIEISDNDFEISDANELTRHLNYNNSNDSELFRISTFESWIIVKTKFFFMGSFTLEFCMCGLLGKHGWHRAGEPWI